MRSLMLVLIGAVCGLAASFALGAWSRPALASDPCLDAAIAPAPQAAASVDARASTATAVPSPAVITAVDSVESSIAPATSASAPTAPVDLPPNTPEAIAALPPASVNDLLLPVEGVAPSALADTFTQARSEGRVHDAIDIMAPRGTPVLATNDGHVVKLFTSERGGLTVYEFGPNDQVLYYYAHLDRYAPGLAEGQTLHRGDLIGFVGSTGNASPDGPHLHFEIEMLGPKKEWWHGTSINPYGRFAGQHLGDAGSHDASR